MNLNVGGGPHWTYPDWLNIDLVESPNTTKVDISSGILPYPDHSFDNVYCSHVIEHFPLEISNKLVSELQRVCKTNGMLNITVPDFDLAWKAYKRKNLLWFRTWSRRLKKRSLEHSFRYFISGNLIDISDSDFKALFTPGMTNEDAIKVARNLTSSYTVQGNPQYHHTSWNLTELQKVGQFVRTNPRRVNPMFKAGFNNHAISLYVERVHETI